MTNYHRISTDDEGNNINNTVIENSNNEDDMEEPILGSSADLSNNTNTDSNLDLENQGDTTYPSRLSSKQRIVRFLHHFVPIKQTYERLNNGLNTGRLQTNLPGRFIGQGTDGVFRNLMAKPDTESNRNRQEQELHPPTYEEAAADSSPEYWESTMISPMYEDEVFVQGLPVGNIANFVWNALVTVAFQFVGFILCYLLHTSHASKQGSRTGLGINLILYGWNLIPSNFGSSNQLPKKIIPNDPNEFDIINKNSKIDGILDNYKSSISLINENNNNYENKNWIDSSSNIPYVAYGLISFGLFIILKAVVDYYKVKQLEKVILNPNTNIVVEQPQQSQSQEQNQEQQQQPNTD
ncbi:unnamed protein product [Candida verbasci]|uniref:Metal homeostatis protein BSD2 n=1 Tax=Candida verbasci TaxID=1227364 RepID=A0A9W4TXA8_9ASCO|nr:unnamed protein product [Candida verbasci]